MPSVTEIVGDYVPDPRQQSVLPAELMAAMAPAADFEFGVHGLFDNSGSFMLNGRTYARCRHGIEDAVLGDPSLAGRVQLCWSDMSGVVVDTGWYDPTQARRMETGIHPGGGSPHLQLVGAAGHLGKVFLEAAKKKGKKGKVVQLYFADGLTPESPAEIDEAMASNAALQSDDWHVYVVGIGPVEHLNLDFLRRISKHHDMIMIPDPAKLQPVFDTLRVLLAAAAKDPAVLGRSRSISTEDVLAAMRQAGHEFPQAIPVTE